MESKSGEEFQISRGGPYYELQRQIGLVRDQADRAVRRALIFAALTALAPLV
ncbi:MAG: hypothetical protein AAGK37_14690 [Pseudomonadota bacterium]